MQDNKTSKAVLLFAYERVKDNVINLNRDCCLRMCIDLGFADKNDNKMRYYKEYYYPSNKYQNISKLITVYRSFTPYLEFEYPRKSDQNNPKGRVLVRTYSMPALRQFIMDFDSKLMNAFYEKKGELKLDSSKVVKVVSNPVPGSSLELSQDLYTYDDGKGNLIVDMGVRIGFNEEYWITVRWQVWKSIVEFFYHCDLYLYGSNLMNYITSNLVGSGINEIGDYSGNKPYKETTYEPDLDDVVKTLTDNDKPKKKATYSQHQNSFFTNL